MNSENSENSHPPKLLLNLTEKIDLRRDEKSAVLSNLSVYYAWKHIKSSYKNKFKIE